MPNRLAAAMRCCVRASETAPDRGVDRRRAERSRELPEARRQQRVEVDVVVQVVLVRGDVAALVGCPDPHAVQLRELLVERHRRDERLDAVVDVQGGVAPRGIRRGIRSRHRFGR